MKLVSELREKCRQLQINLSESNQKIKAVEKAKLKISKQSSLNEDLWKVKYRKIEGDLLKLEKLLYMEPFVHKCFHPANLNLPKSLKNLWTDIKCSRYVFIKIQWLWFLTLLICMSKGKCLKRLNIEQN